MTSDSAQARDSITQTRGSIAQHTDQIAQARGLIAEAKRIVVLTGAGISTDSGIPDFRGPDGVWTKDPKAEKLSTISYYVSDPQVRKRSWKRYTEGLIWSHKSPNAGHRALVDLERRGKLHTLITQNIDGLHEEAGTSTDLLVEIHGTTKRTRCLSCAEELPMEQTLERVRQGEEDPPCLSCGGILKSATISFGQSLVPQDIMRAEQAALGCDLFLAVGTSLQVYPIAGCVPLAHSAGARLVIVNAEPTPFDDIASVVLRDSISEVLPQVVGAG